MPKKAAELGPLAVSRLKTPGLHPVGGVSGLRLQVSATGARSWILRTMIAGRRCDKGLGGFPDVSLAVARESAKRVRNLIAEGVDPIEQNRVTRSALAASVAAAWTFDQCAEKYIEAKTPEWSNAKHAAQWTSSLETYASPFIGNLLVRDVGLPHVLDVLRPIWETKTETATRVRSRLEAVLDWAATSGYRDGVNPARWKGHLENILAAPRKVTKVEHHAALPVADLGAFMAKLRAAEGKGARALEFAILTAARSGEVRGATWEEIDLDAATWIVPAERMKASKEHRVPLSDAAVDLLKSTAKESRKGLVFVAPRGGALSDMTLSAVLRRMKVAAVPHGFRSTFRDWASELTAYPSEMAEMALAHTIDSKVEAAYRRGDLFEKRRAMMADWATFCALVKKAVTVTTPIRAKKAAKA
jgi:integrase